MLAKKALGQNFLKNSGVRDLMVNKVVQYAEKVTQSTGKKPMLIEIGPGRAYVTKAIAEVKDAFSKVLLIEKDDDLASQLEVMPELSGIEVLNADFLDFRLDQLDAEDYIVIGSLPYNVSKKIISNLITAANPPRYSVFLLQKEVAEDYAAEVPRMVFLGAFSKLYAPSKILRNVSPKSFNPAPKVESSVIEFERSDRDLLPEEKSAINKIVRLGFTQPRKTLYNNLKPHFPKEKVMQFLQESLKNEKVRAQDVSIDQWIELYRALS